jgi:three-Cys-motif partner protein
LLASQAERAALLGRNVDLAFVEQDDARRQLLSESLAAAGVAADQILGGDFGDVVDDLLKRYERHAVLLFVDPFGLAIDRPTLERILQRSSPKQPIDILYHFSLSSVARMGRAGITNGPGSSQSQRQLDVALGDVDWRTAFAHADGAGAPTRAAGDVAEAFGASIAASCGLRSLAIPVRQRPDHLPQYVLMLFSKDEQARWDFADVASKAHVDWLLHCDSEDYDAFVRHEEASGVMSLFGPPEPNLDDLESHLKDEAVPYLAERMSERLRRAGTLRPVDDIEGCYGEMLGRARSTHLRAALKALRSQDLTNDNATNDFWMRPISWTGPS